MSRVEVKLPPVPSELKIIAPFTSRAQELSGKEPVIAYYCLYHATQTGISAKVKGKDTNAFLLNLMTALEAMKDQLKDRKEVNSDEAAATYIENFALKVFSNADNEDRKGGSNRSTAKKFLAASNFFELLSIFDAKYLNPLIHPEEKIKYAKWKAADIARAYREGRVPLSGPATTLDGSEDEFAEIQASSHSEIEDASMGSSSGAAVTIEDPQFSQQQSTRGVTTPPTESTTLKPPVSTVEPSSSTKTVTPTKNPSAFLMPKHISTASIAQSSYVVDLSSPATSGPKTPLKSPGISDGLWSTAATPGIDSPNVFPGVLVGSGGRAALSHLNPASIALFNATLGVAKGDGANSPLSPGASPKPKPGLGVYAMTPNNIGSGASHKKGDEEAFDTDEEDGQWSTAGNDPFSRQNSMIPPPSSASFNVSHPPGLTVTSSLGVLQEEVSPQSTPQKQQQNSENQTRGTHNLVPPSALTAPLPPSTSNTAPSSPDARPNSVTFAASHPLPSALPPSTQPPSSIKSDSHVLPTEDSPNKNYKFTSSVVGDSTSDGEASYNVRRRANSTSTGLPPSSAPKLNVEDRAGSHVRSSSVNTAYIPTHPTKGRDAASANGRGVSTSAADDVWEKVSLSRLARLPDSVTGSDMDALSGRLRGLGGSEPESVTPTAQDDGMTTASGSSDFKSRRNTIKANAPYNTRLSESDFGFTLPGVPSAPPGGDWGSGSGKGGGSDPGGEGDMMARLPSAPVIPPLVQDQLPHVTVFPKPTTPRDELRVDPHFPTSMPVDLSGAPPYDLESPSTPRTQTHSRTTSTTSSSGQHAASINSPPQPSFGYQQSPPPSSTTSNTGHSIHRGYAPPNSAISPHSNFTTPMPSVPTQFALAAPFGTSPVQPSAYATNGQVNGFNNAFGLPVNTRPPPTELDPEIVGKAQKHTKFALSALNFEDLETARNELKKALLLLS